MHTTFKLPKVKHTKPTKPTIRFDTFVREQGPIPHPDAFEQALYRGSDPQMD